jgi:hypothetical protein
MNELNPPETPFILNLPSYHKIYFELLGMIVEEYPEEELAIVRYHKNDNEWKIREKGHCQRENPMVQVHRSVIYDLKTKQPIVVSPIRRQEESYDYLDESKSKSKSKSKSGIEDEEVSREFIHTTYWDGTMIHVFFIERLGWVLSSRSKLYATCKFISDRLFSELFKEACDSMGLDIERDLSKDQVYSYVLLHPEIRRVFSVEKPMLKLVQTHSLPKSSCSSSSSSGEITLDWSIEMSYGNDLKSSLVDSVESPDELKDEIPFAKMVVSGWKRYRITNTLYRKFSHYRGVFPKRETCLIEILLRENGIQSSFVKKYRSYFVEDAEEVSRLSLEMNVMIGSLHHLYIRRHIRKAIIHENLPHWSRKPIWDLHGIHIREKKSIHPEDVVNYIRNLKASQIGKLLHDYKKQGIQLLEGRTEPEPEPEIQNDGESTNPPHHQHHHPYQDPHQDLLPSASSVPQLSSDLESTRL